MFFSCFLVFFTFFCFYNISFSLHQQIANNHYTCRHQQKYLYKHSPYYLTFFYLIKYICKLINELSNKGLTSFPHLFHLQMTPLPLPIHPPIEYWHKFSQFSGCFSAYFSHIKVFLWFCCHKIAFVCDLRVFFCCCILNYPPFPTCSYQLFCGLF